MINTGSITQGQLFSVINTGSITQGQLFLTLVLVLKYSWVLETFKQFDVDGNGLIGVRGMPEWDIESLGVMGWGLDAARKLFRRRRRHRPPKVGVW